MIGTLRGRLFDRAESEITVEVGGIGYRVLVTPGHAVGLAEMADPEELLVWIHHHRREDAETLYGFASRDERDLFETLIGTHGVGPALALAVLSVHTPSALRLAVATDDVSALCLVPGVGKKTATRLLMELKSRLEGGLVDLTVIAGTNGVDGGVGASAHSDVRDALSGLGYGPDEIASVVRELPIDGDSSTLLKLALQKLATSF